MKNLTKLPKRWAICVAVALAAFGGSVLATGPKPVAAESAQLYWINFLYPDCDRPCPFYWPELGCWCVKLPPIIVKG